MDKMTADSGNNWREYQRLVLSELERHNALLAKLDEKVDEIGVEIAMLKVRSGVWGALAGLATVGVMIGVRFLL